MSPPRLHVALADESYVTETSLRLLNGRCTPCPQAPHLSALRRYTVTHVDALWFGRCADEDRSVSQKLRAGRRCGPYWCMFVVPRLFHMDADKRRLANKEYRNGQGLTPRCIVETRDIPGSGQTTAPELVTNDLSGKDIGRVVRLGTHDCSEPLRGDANRVGCWNRDLEIV